MFERAPFSVSPQRELVQDGEAPLTTHSGFSSAGSARSAPVPLLRPDVLGVSGFLGSGEPRACGLGWEEQVV